MKKWTALLLAFVMLLCLAACDGSGSESQTKGPGKKPGATTSSPAPNDNVDFQEIVVVDNEFCTIRITGLKPDDFLGFSLNVYLENKSSDTDYYFSVDYASVNGLQVDPFFTEEIAAGKKLNTKITLMDSGLREYIDLYSDIEIAFSVQDSDDWEAEPVAEEVARFYPYGEDKATAFVREPQDGDVVIVDNEDITVIVMGYAEDPYVGFSVLYYIENHTDKVLSFSADDVSVNDFVAEPYWGVEVQPGKAIISSMGWYDSLFEDNGITTVEKIDMTFRVFDLNDWTLPDIFCDTVTLNP